MAKSRETNSERKNGKAWKQKKKGNTSTGKTVGGYSIQKIELRKLKRLNPLNRKSESVDVDKDFSKVNVVLSAPNSNNKEGTK